MTELIDDYKRLAPFLLFIVYALGYVFLTNYYSTFGIDIVFYLNLTDILFLALKLLIFLAIIGFIVEIGLIFLTGFFISVFSKKEKTSTTTYQFSSLLILLILGYVIAFVTGFYFYIFSIIFTLMPIKLYHAIVEKEDHNEDKRKMSLFSFVLLTIILTIITFIFSYYEGFRVKDNNGLLFGKRVEFVYKGKFISTFNNPLLVCIGETSNHLFLFSSPENKTQVFIKSDLESLKFYDPTNFDDAEKQQLEEIEKEMESYRRILNTKE